MQWSAVATGGTLLTSVGCVDSATPKYADSKLQLVWGRRGLSDGRFQKARAMAIDKNDHLYIVDMTGRVQVFDTDGNFLRVWNTPSIANGKPTGLGIDRQGLVMVADTHFYQVLFYTPEGELLADRTIGGTNGKGPGEFGFVTDAVQDRNGDYFVSEYGEFDRIQKFTAEGKFICQFGKHGNGPLEFNRPQSIFLDRHDNLWISDACNHRIQVVRCERDKPEIVAIWGVEGKELGMLHYPYGIWVDEDEHILICEFGNCRVQKMTTDGKPVSSWGTPGRDEGQLYQPWAIVRDSKKRLHILDTNNNRVQRILL